MGANLLPAADQVNTDRTPSHTDPQGVANAVTNVAPLTLGELNHLKSDVGELGYLFGHGLSDTVSTVADSATGVPGPAGGLIPRFQAFGQRAAQAVEGISAEPGQITRQFTFVDTVRSELTKLANLLRL